MVSWRRLADSTKNAGTTAFWGSMFQPASQTQFPRAAEPAEPYLKNPMCIFPDEDREDCGFPGVEEHQCLYMKCCFGEPNGDNLPFCYRPKQTSLTNTPSPTTSYVLPTIPPFTLPTTITETTTTTTTGGSGLLVVLDTSGVVIGVVAACLVGAMITCLLVGFGRGRHYQAKNTAYNERELSPAYPGTHLINDPRGRSDSITGGSYQGLNLHSQYESLQKSPDTARGSWASGHVQNPV